MTAVLFITAVFLFPVVIILLVISADIYDKKTGRKDLW